ncbi:Nif3-like dinuclear metal center hexameric protein [Porphyromonas sp.]
MTPIYKVWEAIAEKLPPTLQESYDNCGLQIGDPSIEATGVLCCVDITEAVLLEAIDKRCNVIIAHHPLLFKGLKQISTSSYIERCVRLAIRHDLTIYAAHTNADNADGGLNYLLAEAIGLESLSALSPMSGTLMELVTFVPTQEQEQVAEALWKAGAGRIGAYAQCSFRSSGRGTFRALEGAHPFIGAIGELHTEQEERLSVTFPSYRQRQVEEALLASHPYETPAYSITRLQNVHPNIGAGVIGELPYAETTESFLRRIESYFKTKQLRYSVTNKQQIKRVAICGGAGAFLWKQARHAGADILITGEAKYNDYFDCEGAPILCTVGHYESESIAAQLFAQIISEKIPNFAVYQSELDSNPIKALQHP